MDPCAIPAQANVPRKIDLSWGGVWSGSPDERVDQDRIKAIQPVLSQPDLQKLPAAGWAELVEFRPIHRSLVAE